MKFSVALLLAAVCLAIAYAQDTSNETTTETPAETTTETPAETTTETPTEIPTEKPHDKQWNCKKQIQECVQKALGTVKLTNLINPFNYGSLTIKCVKVGPHCSLDIIGRILSGGFRAIREIMDTRYD